MEKDRREGEAVPVTLEPLQQLNQEALARYQEVSTDRRRWGGWILLVLLLVCLGVSGRGVLRKLGQLEQEVQREAIQAQVTRQAAGTLIVLPPPGVLPNTADDNSLLLATAAALAEQHRAMHASPLARGLFFPFIQNSSPGDACRDFNATGLEVISGPTLSPQPGTRYAESSPPEVTVSWVVRNRGNCAWHSLALWSIKDGTSYVPEVRLDGELVDLAALHERLRQAEADDQAFEIQLAFEPEAAHKVDAEWVFSINGHYLFTQPHLVLRVEEWLVPAAAAARPGTVVRRDYRPVAPVNPRVSTPVAPTQPQPPPSRPSQTPPGSRP